LDEVGFVESRRDDRGALLPSLRDSIQISSQSPASRPGQLSSTSAFICVHLRFKSLFQVEKV
jgi:hypothetical protein